MTIKFSIEKVWLFLTFHKKLYSFLILLMLLVSSFQLIETAEGNETYPMTDTGLRWPTDASRRLTSTFCEPRPDRFHAGVDFSTRGSVGYPCFAIADGYIYRIKTSFNGYGKVLYLKWGEDQIAVYAHLSEFDKRIEAVVKEEQLRQQSYEIEMYFTPGELEYKQGEVIAYTGETGIGAPHLHFETRDGIGTPYNPALVGFNVPDKRKPVIRRVSIKPLDGSSEVNGDMVDVIRNVNHGQAQPVDVYGRVGISVEARDWQDGGWHRLGVRILELYLNDDLIHRTTLDTFRYRNNRHARLDFDYELWRKGFKRFRRLYVLEGNRLKFYDKNLNGGIIDTDELKTGENEVKIRVVDSSGNERWTSWVLNVLKKPVMPTVESKRKAKPLKGDVEINNNLDLDIQLISETARFKVLNVPDWAEIVTIRSTAWEGEHVLIPKGRGRWIGRGEIPVSFRGTCEFVIIAKRSGKTVTKNITTRIGGFKKGTDDRWAIPEAGIELRVEKDELWFDLVAQLKLSPMESDKIAPVYHFLPYDHPFKKPIEIALSSNDVPWDSNAVIVYQEKGEKRWRFLGNEREMNGFILKAELFSFEKFSVMIDSLPPVISRLSLVNNATTKIRRPRLSASLYDVISGLNYDNCSMEIDGKKVIWVYDPDAKTISYRPWENLSKGRHEWKIIAEDHVGNRRELTQYFRIK